MLSDPFVFKHWNTQFVRLCALEQFQFFGLHFCVVGSICQNFFENLNLISLPALGWAPLWRQNGWIYQYGQQKTPAMMKSCYNSTPLIVNLHSCIGKLFQLPFNGTCGTNEQCNSLICAFM